MTRRSSGRRWTLTVRDGTLALVAPHGVFPVKGTEVDWLARIPEGVEVECEGDYDGAGNINSLIVTWIVRIVTPLVPLTDDVPDDVVHQSAELSRARAAERLGVGDVDGATEDLRYAFDGMTPGTAEVYGALPESQRARLRERYATWVASQKLRWDEARFLPLDDFTREHLDAAITIALERGGRFGTHTVETLVAEVERRGQPIDDYTRATKKLRKAQSTQGGVAFRIFSPMNASVVGATRDTIYVFGWLDIGPRPIVPPDAPRQLAAGTSPVVIAYDTEGVERARYPGIIATRVVEDVALQAIMSGRSRDMPALRRLDGTVLAQFTDNVYHYDAELVCARGLDGDEIRVFATAELVAKWRATSTTRVWWDDTTIHVQADQQRTYPRPPRRAEGWFFEQSGKRVTLGPTKSEAVHIEIPNIATATLVPPWLALQRDDHVVVIALAELMTCDKIRIDGKQIAKRVTVAK
jgi:hypothetical protein